MRGEFCKLMLFHNHKLKLLICFLFFFLLISLPGISHSFKVGEKLVYNVKLLGLPIAEQELEVKDITEVNGYPTYLFTSYTKGSKIFSLFLNLEDRIESFADLKTLYPRMIKMDIHEGSRQEKVNILIDPKNKVAIFKNLKKNEEWERKISYPFLDMISLVYWLRDQQLIVGKVFSIFLADTCGFKKVKIEVTGTEKAYTYRGVYNALVCKEITDGTGIKMWFSIDDRCLPLQIQISTPLGLLIAILKEVH